jgi:hypothetical protein
MDANDNGFFVYSDKYPPICVAPPKHQEKDFSLSMNRAVTHYLRESYEHGLKHPDVILPCGLAVREAAVLYFRDLNVKRKLSEKQVNFCDFITKLINDSLIKHMDIHVQNVEYMHIFDEIITPCVKAYEGNDHFFFKKLTIQLKQFIKHINRTEKGYTIKLKNVVDEINSNLNE